ncbi:sensor histidine kinase [Salinimicrobium xinjiangense]|uniref:sensor histidine kinase n=1 Tax=Salinimicrobium xinjiangense TaxID=438596 RepID=UPI0012ECA242|nr:HAMP domain-containing sensor histidine kinase [Salinimicrobium xinjiangense]
MEQFSYIVSHNLRSPVANILGLADLLQNSEYPHEVKEQFFSEMFSNVERLDAVITDLNSILQAKVDVKAKKEKINLGALVEEIKLSIQPLINEEKAQISYRFENIKEVASVKSYLYSIFYNLIVNSIKYRRPGIPPELEIRMERKGEFILIFFKDNGLGMDLTNKRDQIFNLYKRFHHHIEGKGMGLFMVKTQVEMLGGKITVDSNVNEGTLFTILLKETVIPIHEKNGATVSLFGG